jgi:hypothetical protein
MHLWCYQTFTNISTISKKRKVSDYNAKVESTAEEKNQLLPFSLPKIVAFSVENIDFGYVASLKA